MYKSKVRKRSNVSSISTCQVKKYSRTEPSDSLLKDSQKKKINSDITSKTSSSQVIESKKSNDISFPSSAPVISMKRVSKHSTQISQIYDNPETSSSELNLFRENENGLFYVLFLPFVVDEKLKRIKQPVLLNLSKEKLLKLGFEWPFDKFSEDFFNLFQLEFDSYCLMGEIISIGSKFLFQL